MKPFPMQSRGAAERTCRGTIVARRCSSKNSSSVIAYFPLHVLGDQLASVPRCSFGCIGEPFARFSRSAIVRLRGRSTPHLIPGPRSNGCGDGPRFVVAPGEDAIDPDCAHAHPWPARLVKRDVERAADGVGEVIGAMRAVIDAVLARAVDAALQAAQFSEESRVIRDGNRAAIEVGQVLQVERDLGSGLRS